MNKLLLIIVEGTSDKITLYLPLKNFIRKNKLMLNAEITSGDITLKENASKESCLNSIKDIINTFKSNYSLFPSDFYKVVHVIDTDGAFIDNDSIYRLSSNNCYYVDDKSNLIYTPNIQNSVKINSNKKEIYKYLASLDKISNVPYQCLFFSRNLEHALYDISNASIEDKINLSNKFESKYENDKDGFYNKIKEIAFTIPLKYKESWDYIFKDLNSLKRCSNFLILLNELENNINSKNKSNNQK